jgi:predicted HicB family RNase H-like nuclease
MKDMMQHKGYYGSVHFDPDEPVIYGKLEFIKALISYEANDAEGIKQAFQGAVEDYLDICKKEDRTPEKPFKGSFNIRAGHKLHEKIALAAQRENLSINKFICAILEKACHQKKSARHR